jgi:hypothetical protein
MASQIFEEETLTSSSNSDEESQILSTTNGRLPDVSDDSDAALDTERDTDVSLADEVGLCKLKKRRKLSLSLLSSEQQQTKKKKRQKRDNAAAVKHVAKAQQRSNSSESIDSYDTFDQDVLDVGAIDDDEEEEEEEESTDEDFVLHDEHEHHSRSRSRSLFDLHDDDHMRNKDKESIDDDDDDVDNDKEEANSDQIAAALDRENEEKLRKERMVAVCYEVQLPTITDIADKSPVIDFDLLASARKRRWRAMQRGNAAGGCGRLESVTQGTRELVHFDILFDELQHEAERGAGDSESDDDDDSDDDDGEKRRKRRRRRQRLDDVPDRRTGFADVISRIENLYVGTGNAAAAYDSEDSFIDNSEVVKARKPKRTVDGGFFVHDPSRGDATAFLMSPWSSDSESESSDSESSSDVDSDESSATAGSERRQRRPQLQQRQRRRDKALSSTRDLGRSRRGSAPGPSAKQRLRAYESQSPGVRAQLDKLRKEAPPLLEGNTEVRGMPRSLYPLLGELAKVARAENAKGVITSSVYIALADILPYADSTIKKHVRLAARSTDFADTLPRHTVLTSRDRAALAKSGKSKKSKPGDKGATARDKAAAAAAASKKKKAAAKKRSKEKAASASEPATSTSTAKAAKAKSKATESKKTKAKSNDGGATTAASDAAEIEMVRSSSDLAPRIKELLGKLRTAIDAMCAPYLAMPTSKRNKATAPPRPNRIMYSTEFKELLLDAADAQLKLVELVHHKRKELNAKQAKSERKPVPRVSQEMKQFYTAVAGFFPADWVTVITLKAIVTKQRSVSKTSSSSSTSSTTPPPALTLTFGTPVSSVANGGNTNVPAFLASNFANRGESRPLISLATEVEDIDESQ